MRKEAIRFVVRYVRPIWSTLGKMAYWIFYRIQLETSPALAVKYLSNKNAWEAVRDLTSLCRYFQTRFTYKPDGLAGTPEAGLIDHDNSLLEFLCSGGDCDDAARFAVIKLRELGYQATRWHFVSEDIRKYHFDAVILQALSVTLFNYGNLTVCTGNPLEGMNTIFPAGTYIDAFPVD